MNPEIATTQTEIERLELELVERGERLAEMKRRQPREAVQDYTLAGWNGPVQLSELFAGKPDLIVVHNMGRGCRYCTLWADGFNGVYPHLADRAAFVVCSPDPVETQREFATGRGWRFPMVSGRESSFTQDMGFGTEKGWMPGASTFHREPTGGIVRVAKTLFGPFDPYCSIWHLFGLLAEGVNDWEPQYRYE